jgi:hypothetical protein
MHIRYCFYEVTEAQPGRLKLEIEILRDNKAVPKLNYMVREQ